jgi:hypothetical protein
LSEHYFISLKGHNSLYLRRKRRMKLRVLAVLCVALLVAPAAFAELSATMNIAGDVETNTDVQFKDDGAENYMSWGNGGRTHIKFDGTVEGDNGWFAYGIGDAMIDVTGSVGVDDAYVEFGTESFSFLIGRYEAPGAFGKGQDTFIAEAPGAPSRYQGDYARGRLPINNMALKFAGGFELGVIVGGLEEGTIYGVTTDPDTGVTTPGVIEIETALNAYGVRPHYSLSTDTMTLNIAAEYLSLMPQNTDASDAQLNLFGGSANLEFDLGGTLGLSLSYGGTTGQDDAGDDLLDQNTLSGAVYYTMPVGEGNSLGLYGGYTALSVDKFTDDTMFEGFLSFNQQLPVEGLWIKYALSYAGASFDYKDLPDPDDTSSFGGRVRFNYDF